MYCEIKGINWTPSLGHCFAALFLMSHLALLCSLGMGLFLGERRKLPCI